MAVVCLVKIWNCNKLFLPKFCELFDVLGAVEEQVINDWAHDFLSSEIFAAFIQEKDELKDLIVLGDETSNLDNFPVHMTLMNIIKKVSMTEAAVERAFLRHRLDHTRLRSNLAAKKLTIPYFCVIIVKIFSSLERKILMLLNWKTK